jgi:hypothetical protein
MDLRKIPHPEEAAKRLSRRTRGADTAKRRFLHTPSEREHLRDQMCRHSRRGDHRHRLHPLRYHVHLDLVAGRSKPFSAAISGAISRTRETSSSKVSASVVNGSSSFEHHHAPASPSHSALISKLFSSCNVPSGWSSAICWPYEMVPHSRKQNRYGNTRIVARAHGSSSIST